MKIRMNMTSPEAIQTRMVEITAVAVLPDEEYRDFLVDYILPRPMIERLNKYTAPETSPGSCNISRYKAMLVCGKYCENGVAVCGKDTVAYASHFPGARSYLDRSISRNAEKLEILAGIADNKRPVEIPLSKMNEIIKTNITDDNGIGELVLNELKTRPSIESVTLNGDTFEIYYTPQITESNEKHITLADLVRCGLYDVQLCHMDEEIDSATIVELNGNTLTEQGKADWSDVLDATVEEIAGGGIETAIGLSDVTPERLANFSLMLAGHCHVSDYGKWVTDGEEPAPEQGMNM